MYLLDSNVVPELRRVRPHGAVLAWVESVADEDLRLSAVTIGEIQSGIEITRQQDPNKAAEIEVWLEQVTETYKYTEHGREDLPLLGAPHASQVGPCDRRHVDRCNRYGS
jgi:predicted nucleic acid-binding protein